MPQVSWTFEELGKSFNKDIEVLIEYDCEDAEPATRDYPGSPGYSEPTSVEVLKMSDPSGDVNNFGDWEPVISKIAMNLAEKHWYDIQESIGEDMADAEMAAAEAYYESLRDELRGC